MRKDDLFYIWHRTFPVECLSSVLYGTAMRFMARSSSIILKNIIKSLNPNMTDSEIEAYIQNNDDD